MREFLRNRSRRRGYDGWALLMPGARVPLPWSVCTTRAECRQVRAEYPDLMVRNAEIVKVKISIEVAA